MTECILSSLDFVLGILHGPVEKIADLHDAALYKSMKKPADAVMSVLLPHVTHLLDMISGSQSVIESNPIIS